MKQQEPGHLEIGNVGSNKDFYKGISVVIPAYNEEGGIALVVSEVSQVLGEFGWSYEIVVVDDGSEDDTAKAAAGINGVRVLQHKSNKGYGASLKTGIRHANYDLIVITDADGTYPCQRIPDLIAEIADSDWDMVVGARKRGQVAIPWMRRPAKWFIRKLAEMVAEEPIQDLNSGLRVFKRSAVMPFFSMIPEGFSFTTTITLAMLTNGYLIEYIPIEYYHRVGKSKIRPIRDTLNFMQLVLRIALYFAPLKIFLPLSGIFMLIGIGWAVYTSLLLGQLADASTAVIFMTAVQIGVLGLLAELLDRRLPNYYRSQNRSDM